jgi:hypothetical protein
MLAVPIPGHGSVGGSLVNSMRHSSLQWGKWIPLAGISLLTIVGAALRAYHLGFKPLWFDEAVVYWIANHPIPDLVVHNSLENSAPPLFCVASLHRFENIG